MNEILGILAAVWGGSVALCITWFSIDEWSFRRTARSSGASDSASGEPQHSPRRSPAPAGVFATDASSREAVSA
jgi:hypothetical protein